MKNCNNNLIFKTKWLSLRILEMPILFYISQLIKLNFCLSEKLNLKSEVSLNRVDIFPYETIKYTKETQTINSIDDSNKNNIDGTCTSDEDNASNFKANHDHFNLMNFETPIKKSKPLFKSIKSNFSNAKLI